MIRFTAPERQNARVAREIIEAVGDQLRSRILVSGSYTKEFEHWIANYTNHNYAVTTSSGSEALRAIAAYFRHERKAVPDVIKIPTMTFKATANAFIQAGHEIEFVDCNSDGISPGADVYVGLYGNYPAEHRETRFLCHDAAHHWPTLINAGGQNYGSSTAAVSFDPTKNLSCLGNGGCVLTNSVFTASFVRNFVSHGKGMATGTNSRMSELDARVLLIKSDHFAHWQSERRELALYWDRCFANIPQVRSLTATTMALGHGLQKYVIEVDDARGLLKYLERAAIETKVHYTPLHELPEFSHIPGPGIASAASALSRRVISLPFYPELTQDEREYIAEKVTSFYTTQ